MNKQNRNRLINTEYRLMDARGEGIGELCKKVKLGLLLLFLNPHICRKIIMRQTTSVNLYVLLGFRQLSLNQFYFSTTVEEGKSTSSRIIC